jgi:hypothetical protein
MTHADRIAACGDCRPDEGDALDTMEKIVLGERDPEKWLCEEHREEMNEATREWAAQRERSS